MPRASASIRSAREFTVEVKTANGSTRAAPVQLGMVEINGITVHNVAALVSPDEALSENLLGLSFLSRLRRFEFSNGRHGAGAVALSRPGYVLAARRTHRET